MSILVKIIILSCILFFTLISNVNAESRTFRIQAIDPDGYVAKVMLILKEPSSKMLSFEMYDDGMHDDILANDTTYGLTIDLDQNGKYNWGVNVTDNDGVTNSSDLWGFENFAFKSDMEVIFNLDFNYQKWDVYMDIYNPFNVMNFSYNVSLEKDSRLINFYFNDKKPQDYIQEETETELWIKTLNILEHGINKLYIHLEREKETFNPTSNREFFGISSFPLDTYRYERPLLEGFRSNHYTVKISKIPDPYILDLSTSGFYATGIVSKVDVINETSIGISAHPKEDLYKTFNFVNGEYTLNLENPEVNFIPNVKVNILTPFEYRLPVYVTIFSLLSFVIIRPFYSSKKMMIDNLISRLIKLPDAISENLNYWVKTAILIFTIFIFFRYSSNLTIPYENLKSYFTFLDWYTWLILLVFYIAFFSVLEKFVSKYYHPTNHTESENEVRNL